MIEAISTNSFIFRELIDFWKFSTDLPVTFIKFCDDDTTEILTNKYEKKTVAFYNSNNKAIKFSSLDIYIESNIQDAIKKCSDFNFDHLNLINSKPLFNQIEKPTSGFIQINYAVSIQKKPIVYQAQENLLIFALDLEDIISNYLLDKINHIKRGIYSRLPFNYKKLPSFIKRYYLGLLKKLRFKKDTPEGAFQMSWPENYVIDILRYVFLASLHEFLKISIAYISLWPKGINSPFLMSFDFDSKDSFSNFPRFFEKYGINNTPTCFILADNSNLTCSKELMKQSSSLDISIGSHGFNHDGKLMYLNNVDLDKRFRKIKDLFPTRFGFRNEQLHFDIDFLNRICIELSFDSSISDTMYDLNGVRGCGTIFPYFLPTCENLLEIPLTIPMEFEFQFKKLDVNNSIDIVISKTKSIILMRGIINSVFHPEKDLSANEIWMDYYNRFINLIKQNIQSGVISPLSYEDLTTIWTQRKNSKLKQDQNELYISDPIERSLNEKKEIKKRYQFEIKYC